MSKWKPDHHHDAMSAGYYERMDEQLAETQQNAGEQEEPLCRWCSTTEDIRKRHWCVRSEADIVCVCAGKHYH